MQPKPPCDQIVPATVCNRSATSRRPHCNRPATSLRLPEILVARRSPTGCKQCVTGALYGSAVVVTKLYADIIIILVYFSQPLVWYGKYQHGSYQCMVSDGIHSLKWRNNERDGISNHQPHDCLLNRLFKAQIKENFKAPVTGMFPHKRPVMRKMFQFNDVIMWS